MVPVNRIQQICARGVQRGVAPLRLVFPPFPKGDRGGFVHPTKKSPLECSIRLIFV
jgi:hypothetical protein